MTGGRLNWEAGQRARSDNPGARKGHTPVRTCIGCRQRTVAGDLLRMVAMDGSLVVDESRRFPGRGAWLHHDPRCLAMAERRRAFSRALRVSGELDIAPVRHYFGQDSQSTTVAGSPGRSRKEESRSTRHESAVKLKP